MREVLEETGYKATVISKINERNTLTYGVCIPYIIL
ncbi:hypothetical protein [Oceanobacillus arenosus]|nr:hypothetical protein [Oceanobacillus arenosus]